MTLLLTLFIKLSLLSAVAFGGIIAVLPTFFDVVVTQEKWISAQTFADYFAIAQAAPGPNFMTVTLIGWHVYGALGAVVATIAIAWPSSILVYYLQRLILGMQDAHQKKSIQYAAAALAIGLVLSSAWQIALQINHSYSAYALTLLTIGMTVFTRWHPLYLIGLGAILGAWGLI